MNTMIEILLRHPRILHQTVDAALGLPEPPIAMCADVSPLIVLSQEGREIIVNLASVDELCKALKNLRRDLLIEKAEEKAKKAQAA